MTNKHSKDSNNEGAAPPFPFRQQNEALLLISLQEFDAQLPTEEAAREDVKIRLEKENLLFCHDCSSHNLEKKYGARVLKCLDCGNKTWITAGTFFHHAKRIKPRLAVLWLMERGFIVTSSKLHKLTDIAQSSAFNILKRVAVVIEAHMERNICEIPSAVFSKVICKRSRETPARAHPLAEQEEMDALEQEQYLEHEQYLEQEQQENLQKQLPEKHQKECNASAATSPHSPSSQDSTYNQLSQQEKELYDLLSETPVSFEELYVRSGMSVANATAALVILEIAGLVSSLPGNNYARCVRRKNFRNTANNGASSEAFAKFEVIVLDVGSFIRNSFHGISRKYLQHYLSTYWYYVDKSFWQLDSLLSACFRFHPIKLTEIISYVTPPAVKYCEV